MNIPINDLNKRLMFIVRKLILQFQHTKKVNRCLEPNRTRYNQVQTVQYMQKHKRTN